MALGLDYVSGPSIASMKAAGVSFVCRYLSFVNPLTEGKLLKADEARALHQAGIAIVSNYEWYEKRPLEGEASGIADAKIAAEQHAACGGPADRPIYFSVDMDVDGSQVADYFRGVASVLGLARTGAYGSFKVLTYLFDNHLIEWGWQTYAWSDGEWEPRAHIEQWKDSVLFAGESVDLDRSTTHEYGAWGRTDPVLPDTLAKAGWRLSNGVLYAPHPHNTIPIPEPWCSYLLKEYTDPDEYPLAVPTPMQVLEQHNPAMGSGMQFAMRFQFLETQTGKENVVKVSGGAELYWYQQAYAKILADYTQLQAIHAAKIEEANTRLAAAYQVVQHYEAAAKSA